MAISGPASPRSKLEGLVARGFQVDRSDPEYLTGALFPLENDPEYLTGALFPLENDPEYLTGALFPLENGWALIRRQPSVSARSAATPTARCGIRSRGR
jgi:hypothetical protein